MRRIRCLHPGPCPVRHDLQLRGEMEVLGEGMTFSEGVPESIVDEQPLPGTEGQHSTVMDDAGEPCGRTVSHVGTGVEDTVVFTGPVQPRTVGLDAVPRVAGPVDLHRVVGPGGLHVDP